MFGVPPDYALAYALQAQSNFAPDSFTTFAQRAFSLRMNAPNCSGDCGSTSAPAATSFSFISAERNGIPLLPSRKSAQAVTLELVNQLRDEQP